MKQRKWNKKRKTNREILELIRTANELKGNSGAENVMDLRLRLMSLKKDGKKWMNNCEIGSKSGTIGKRSTDGYTVTCPQRIKIWAKNENYACFAGHIMHEYMHNIGFSHHPPYKTKSAVYKTGYLVRNIIQGNNKKCPNE
jgi:hypothetical protein